MSPVNRLLTLSGGAFVSGPALLAARPGAAGGRLVSEWLQMLDSVNGFYCFESALHVFPSRTEGDHIGLSEWNAQEGWRREYAQLDRGALFVAEDIFGDQFCILGESICRFDAETAQITGFASCVAEWAEKVTFSFNEETGFPLAHQWQSLHGALPIGQRLAPKIPFVLGGAYEVTNLFACNAAAAMRGRGNLAVQIANVPDGTPIEYKVVG